MEDRKVTMTSHPDPTGNTQASTIAWRVRETKLDQKKLKWTHRRVGLW